MRGGERERDDRERIPLNFEASNLTSGKRCMRAIGTLE